MCAIPTSAKQMATVESATHNAITSTLAMFRHGSILLDIFQGRIYM